MDLIIYLKNLEDIHADAFVAFAKKFKMDVEVHPEADFVNDDGFMPFKIVLEEGKYAGKELITGFEYYPDEYELEEEEPETEEEKKARTLLKECKAQVTLTIHGDDMMEERIAFCFAAYLAEECGGLVYDTYEGEYLFNHVAEDLYAAMLYDEKTLGDAGEVMPFEGWI